jgi:hypothetical protein
MKETTRPNNLKLGISSFREIIENNILYIDKTEFISKLLSKYSKSFLLCRPKGFGKSLLLSTIENIFKGNKFLFNGLAIDKVNYKFEEYPIFKCDMSELRSDNVDFFRNGIISLIKRCADNYEISIKNSDDNMADLFSQLIDYMAIKYKKQPIILIDEYDTPITENIIQKLPFNDINNILATFYSNINNLRKKGKIHFTFYASISNLAKKSTFLGANEAVNLSLIPEFANICGFTSEEIKKIFSIDITKLLKKIKSRKKGVKCETRQELYDIIISKYGGYSWDGYSNLCNPYFILNCFIKSNIINLWLHTDQKNFMIDLIKKENIQFDINGEIKMTRSLVEALSSNNPRIIPLLFHYGYLSLANNDKNLIYTLKIPNESAKSALEDLLR